MARSFRQCDPICYYYMYNINFIHGDAAPIIIIFCMVFLQILFNFMIIGQLCLNLSLIYAIGIVITNFLPPFDNFYPLVDGFTLQLKRPERSPSHSPSLSGCMHVLPKDGDATNTCRYYLYSIVVWEWVQCEDCCINQVVKDLEWQGAARILVDCIFFFFF